MKIKPIPYSHCDACGKRFDDQTSWPRTCVVTDVDGCGRVRWHNPTPIGVLLQTVTDGKRLGILTPTRGNAPQRGLPGLVGGYQEAGDDGGDDAAMREYLEEIRRRMQGRRVDLDIILSRASGPMEPPGSRQTLLFSVNHVPIHVDEFDDWQPDAETLAIDFSWEPRVLAFPTHTQALALYFLRFHEIEAPAAYMDQPRTGDRLVGLPGIDTIHDVPYQQDLLDEGFWSVTPAAGRAPVAVRRQHDAWEAR